jgi:hypothetical protein
MLYMPQPVNAHKSIHVQGVRWVHKSVWWRWELQEQNETNNLPATWILVKIEFQIKYRINSVESSEEETWK